MCVRLKNFLLFAGLSVLTGCTIRDARSKEAFDLAPPTIGHSTNHQPGFYVSGRHLFDRCGEQVVLRGVNEMVVWTEGRDGMPEFGEIAKTGANAVRIVWTSEGSAGELSAAIRNAAEHKLIPIIENHEATGNLQHLGRVVDWWTQPQIVDVVKAHAPYLIVNIANEAGDQFVTPEEFLKAYKHAITRIRAAGIANTLVIDAPSWGQNIDVLQKVGSKLIGHDPLANLLLSVHMWWGDANGERVVKELQETADLGLPLIIGEFAQHAVNGCDENPFDYQTLMTEAQKHSIGWLAWSWGGLNNSDCAGQGSFDMTRNGVYGNWEEAWGKQVALTHPASIANTSIRPFSMVSGHCEADAMQENTGGRSR